MLMVMRSSVLFIVWFILYPFRDNRLTGAVCAGFFGAKKHCLIRTLQEQLAATYVIIYKYNIGYFSTFKLYLYLKIRELLKIL